MKKLALFLSILLAFSHPVYAGEVSNNSIMPRASYVFTDVSSGITKSYYGGDCGLTDIGSGKITLYLQKKLESNNSWLNVDGETATKVFSETSTCSFSKSKTLSAGTYRCKTYVIGYVNGYTDRRTVYSPELTIH